MTIDAYRNQPRRDRAPRLRTLHRAVRLASLGVGIGLGAGLAALALQLTIQRPLTPETTPPEGTTEAAQAPAAEATPPPEAPESTPVSLGMSPDQARASLARDADAVIKALHDRDTRALAAMIDADVGLEFGPAGELENERRALGKKEVEGCFHDRRARVWGDDITLTCAAYWERFVYDRDFAASANIAYNEHPDYTPSFSRAFAPQPDEAFVEYYVPPDPPRNLRASALILVFSPIGRAWKLTGIAHAEPPPPEGE